MADRVQMTRKRPWRADHPDAVIVARPTQWGNPYRIERHMFGGWTIRNTATDKVLLLGTNRRDALLGCVELYRQAIEDQREFVPRPSNIRYDLAGRDLACWCPLDQPCHADVLLELANAREDRGQTHTQTEQPTET